MDILEENVIEVNNAPISDWGNVNNLATSDEASPVNQDTSYAKDHRGKTAVSISLFAISGAAILTGGSLLSSIITEPTLSNVTISTSSNSITMNLSIKNPQGLEVISSLFEDDTLKEETDMSYKGEKEFSYTYNNVDFSRKNIIKISFNNRLDYSKIIYEKEITLNSTKNAKIGGYLYV